MSKYTIIVEGENLEPLVANVIGVLGNFPDIKWRQENKRVVVRTRPARQVQSASLSARFEALFQRWKKETLMTSNGDEIIGHPAYRDIIALGELVVPFILIKLREDPQHLLYALYKITGENPVYPEHAGQLRQMAADWLQWGKEKGYLS